MRLRALSEIVRERGISAVAVPPCRRGTSRDEDVTDDSDVVRCLVLVLGDLATPLKLPFRGVSGGEDTGLDVADEIRGVGFTLSGACPRPTGGEGSRGGTLSVTKQRTSFLLGVGRISSSNLSKTEDESSANSMASPASVGARGRVVRGARCIGEAGASDADTDLASALTDSSGRVEVDIRLCRLEGSVCEIARCSRGDDGPARVVSV